MGQAPRQQAIIEKPEYEASVHALDYSLLAFLKHGKRAMTAGDVAKLIELQGQVAAEKRLDSMAREDSPMSEIYHYAINQFRFAAMRSGAINSNAQYILDCLAAGHNLFGKELVAITHDEWRTFAAGESNHFFMLLCSQMIELNAGGSAPAGSLDLRVFESLGYHGAKTLPAVREHVQPQLEAFLAWVFFTHAQIAHLRGDMRKLLADRESMLPPATRMKRPTRSLTKQMETVRDTLQDGQSITEMHQIVAQVADLRREFVSTDAVVDFQDVEQYIARNGMLVVLYSDGGMRYVLRFPKVESVAHQTYTALQAVLLDSGKMVGDTLVISEKDFEGFQRLWQERRLVVQQEIVIAAQEVRARRFPALLDAHFQTMEQCQPSVDAVLQAATSIRRSLSAITTAVDPAKPKITPLTLLAVHGQPTRPLLSERGSHAAIHVVADLFSRPMDNATAWLANMKKVEEEATHAEAAASALKHIARIAIHVQTILQQLPLLARSPHFQSERVKLEAILGVVAALGGSDYIGYDQYLLLNQYADQIKAQLPGLIEVLGEKKQLFQASVGGWVGIKGTVADCLDTVFKPATSAAYRLPLRFALDDVNEERWTQFAQSVIAAAASQQALSEESLIELFFTIFAVQEKVPGLPKLYSDAAYKTPDEATVGSIDGRPNTMSILFRVGQKLYELNYTLGRLALRDVAITPGGSARGRRTVVFA